VVGVRKCADNNGDSPRSARMRQRKWQVHRRTQEVEERSRWRWSLRYFSEHRNQDRFIPFKGARPFGRAPFSCMASAANERVGVVGDVAMVWCGALRFPARGPATPTICANRPPPPRIHGTGRSRPATSGLTASSRGVERIGPESGGNMRLCRSRALLDYGYCRASVMLSSRIKHH
jgi:hypothetical protein